MSLIIENHSEYVPFQSITETAPLLRLSRRVKVRERQIPSEGKHFFHDSSGLFVCWPPECPVVRPEGISPSLPCFPEPLPPLPEGHSVWWVKNKQVEGPPVLAVCVSSLPGSVSGRAVTDKLFSVGAKLQRSKSLTFKLLLS